ncbi:hypothetical protein PM082_004596 [Marasmius tenuissimus]|nr:hypothetical protein PM082_004596 [Marasmius tenuissimus]
MNLFPDASLPVEVINNMQCVRYPFPNPLFYWSRDPQGEQIIAKKDWEESGIPKLEMKARMVKIHQEDPHDIPLSEGESKSKIKKLKTLWLKDGFPPRFLVF